MTRGASMPDHGGHRQVSRRTSEIRGREGRACAGLHTSTTFAAKGRDIRWKASPAFAKDFRQGNWES